MCDTIGSIFGAEDTSDVTFRVGPSKTKFVAHICILAVATKDLYDLVMTEQESASLSCSSSSNNNNNNNNNNDNEIVLKGLDERSCEAVLECIYKGRTESTHLAEQDVHRALN